MKAYLLALLIAIDQLVNALLCGQPDETLSSRAHRMRVKGHRYWGWTARAIDTVFFWDRDHCRKAYESELRRRHLPESMTKPPPDGGFFTSE